MNKISVREFYSCGKITTGSELYYVSLLGAYLQKQGYSLSLEGVKIPKILLKSKFWEYFRLAYDKKWIVDVEFEDIDKLVVTRNYPLDLSGVVNRIFCVATDLNTEIAVEPVQENFEPQKCRFAIDENNGDWMLAESYTGYGTNIAVYNLRPLNVPESGGKAQCFISIIAYVAVSRYFKNFPERFTIECGDAWATNTQNVADVLLLQSSSSALGDWFQFDYSEGVKEDRIHSIGYEVWKYRGQELGFKHTFYSSIQKFEYLTKGLKLEVGDVVGMYERGVIEKNNIKVKGLTDFNYAVIREITAKGVKLDILNYPKTHYKRVKELLAISKEQIKNLYAGNVPGLKTSIDNKNFCWNDLGIEYMLFEEKYFIVPLQLDDCTEFDIGKEGFLDFYEEYKNAVYYDEVPEKFEKMQEDFENYSNEEWVNEADHIYWFLKEDDIEFNETRFKNRYFKKGYTPLFDRVSAERAVGKGYKKWRICLTNWRIIVMIKCRQSL